MKIKNLRPPGVHVRGGRYYFVKLNKWTGLSRVDEGLRELYRRLSLIDDEASPGNMLAIFVKYAEGPMLKLAEATQKQYNYFFFGTEKVQGVLNLTFGHLMPYEIEPTLVAQFLEKAERGRRPAPGRERKGGPVAGNRAKAALSSVFEFAMRKGWAKYNPCRGVRRNKERASKKRIKTSADLSTTMDQAPDHFAHVMQFAYVLGVRQIDIIKMEVSAITPDGIRYNESKTGKPALHPWTQTLRELVREILEARSVRMNRPYTNKYRKPRVLPVHDRLFTNRFGKPLTMWGAISNMRRLNPDGWSFRSMRSKAQNDGGDLGHTGQMFETYNKERKLRPVR